MQSQTSYHKQNLAHTQALLTLRQLHQYQELCYQFYLYVEALEEAIVARTTVMALAGGGFILDIK